MPDLSSLDTAKNRILSILLLCLVLVIWQASPVLFKIPAFILPSASAVAEGLWRGLTNGLYLYHGAVTLFEVLAGFALGGSLGLALGVAVALNRRFAYFIYPYIIMFQSMPKVALAPLFVLWFGLGVTSKIVTAALVAFFPMMINTISGLNSADKDRIDLIRSLGGSERQVFTMLRLSERPALHHGGSRDRHGAVTDRHRCHRVPRCGCRARHADAKHEFHDGRRRIVFRPDHFGDRRARTQSDPDHDPQPGAVLGASWAG